MEAGIGLAGLEGMACLTDDLGYGISIHWYFALGCGGVVGLISIVYGGVVGLSSTGRQCRLVRHDFIMTQSTSEGTLTAWCDNVAFTFVVNAGDDHFFFLLLFG